MWASLSIQMHVPDFVHFEIALYYSWDIPFKIKLMINLTRPTFPRLALPRKLNLR